jgi:hypothetical protein
MSVGHGEVKLTRLAYVLVRDGRRLHLRSDGFRYDWCSGRFPVAGLLTYALERDEALALLRGETPKVLRDAKREAAAAARHAWEQIRELREKPAAHPQQTAADFDESPSPARGGVR